MDDHIVECPHCGSGNEVWELSMNDGDSQSIDCSLCSKEFEIECSISVSYEVTIPEPKVE